MAIWKENSKVKTTFINKEQYVKKRIDKTVTPQGFTF